MTQNKIVPIELFKDYAVIEAMNNAILQLGNGCTYRNDHDNKRSAAANK